MLAIIVVLYRSGDAIRPFWESLRAQTDGDFRLIAIDNPSATEADDAVGVLSEARDVRIAVIANTENVGFARAVNQGLRRAYAEGCDRFMLLNPDTVFAPDFLYNVTTPKFASMAIKKASEMKWGATHFLANVSASIGSVFKPAGYENGQGIITTAYLKDPTDPSWKDDAGYKNWLAFIEKYMPDADRTNGNHVYGYSVAQTLVEVLKMSGNDLSRENVMKQAASLKGFGLDMLLPGVKIDTSATDFAPIQQEQLQKFKGETWERFGPVFNAAEGKS